MPTLTVEGFGSFEVAENKRLVLGCFPWKFKGGEAAFARVVAFTGEWTS